MSFKIKFSKTVIALFERLIEAILKSNPKPKMEGGEMTLDFAPFISITERGNFPMPKYTLPNDTAPISGSISPLTAPGGGPVLDAEGEPVAITEEFVSSNPGVVSITGDPRSFTLGMGTSGVASIDYVASYMVGRNKVIAKHVDASFIITTGQAGPTEGGDLTLNGITPDPE